MWRRHAVMHMHELPSFFHADMQGLFHRASTISSGAAIAESSTACAASVLLTDLPLVFCVSHASGRVKTHFRSLGCYQRRVKHSAKTVPEHALQSRENSFCAMSLTLGTGGVV